VNPDQAVAVTTGIPSRSLERLESTLAAINRPKTARSNAVVVISFTTRRCYTAAEN